MAVLATSSSTMPVSRYAIVRDGVVEQITLWDADSAPGWQPPAGCEAVQCPDDLHLGATYNGKTFTKPKPAPSAQAVAEAIGPDNLTESERATFKMLAAKVAG